MKLCKPFTHGVLQANALLIIPPEVKSRPPKFRSRSSELGEFGWTRSWLVFRFRKRDETSSLFKFSNSAANHAFFQNLANPLSSQSAKWREVHRWRELTGSLVGGLLIDVEKSFPASNFL